MTDRIERVREKAREVEKSTDELYGDGGRYAAEAYVAGAHAYRTLTDTEWEAMREDVARAIHMADQSLYGVGTDWDGMADWWRVTMESYADAAMTAMGFRRKDQP